MFNRTVILRKSSLSACSKIECALMRRKTTGNNLCKMFNNYTKAKDDFTYFLRMRHFYLWNPDKDAICEYAGSESGSA